MAEISTFVTASLLEWLENHSCSGTAWAADICDPEDLREVDAFVDWDIFVQLCERLAQGFEDEFDSTPQFPTPAEIGREIAEELFSSAPARNGVADVPVETLFIEESLNLAKDLFPDFEVRADIAADGRVVLLELELPDDCVGCPTFFELIKGVLEAAPLLLDQEPVEVAVEINPESARYAVAISRSVGQLIPIDPEVEVEVQVGVGVGVGVEVAVEPTVLNDLVLEPVERPPPQLVDSPQEISTFEPNQSFDHAEFIRSLAACADVDEVGRHLFALLVERFDCAASQVWLDAPVEIPTTDSEVDVSADVRQATPRLAFGDSVKPPTRSLRLGVGATPLGRIDLWDSDALAEEQLELLENLLPWYSLALTALAEGEIPAPTATSTVVPDAPQHPANSRITEILGSIASGSPSDGEDLLEKLVFHLAEFVGAYSVVVSVAPSSAPMRLRTIVAWNDGTRVENFSYDATGTPCANVLAGDLACYPSDVRQQFLADSLLAASQTESYLGIPLRDRDARVIGILNAWSREAIAHPSEAIALIRVLARAAEGELQSRRDLDRKRSDDARYRSLVAASHDICVELSPDRGLLEISNNVYDMLGYTPALFAEASYRELIHPDDLPLVIERYREAQQEELEVEANVRIRHAGGRWCWLEAKAQSYRAQDGELRIIVSARDISERATLEQEHAQMISIIHNSSDLIVLTALNGGVLFLNTAGQRTLGLASDEEAQAKSIYDFVHEDDMRALKFEIMPAVHRHKEWSGELSLRHFKTKRRVTALTSMFVVEDRRTQQPAAIAMICRDVSDRLANERALLESEERYRMLADNPYELIAELDEHGNFIFASSSFETILGYSPETLLGSLGFDLVHPEDRDGVVEGFSSTVSKLTTTHGSYRAIHCDGSYRWLETTIRGYRTGDSKMIAVLISRDVSERIEADEALRLTEQKLQQSQKMEAIGRMAGGIAHDFNNLLTAITGYCDLLLEELGAQHPARADAEEILKASERAAGLTHQLLAFSRRQVLQTRILDLNHLVADMDRMLRRLIGEDVELVTLLDGTAWPIKGDPGQLQQVLLNLVVNARDAMPRGGRITIETANTTLEEATPTELDEIPAGEYLTLSVSDNGAGMTPEIRSMIFEPFFTTKESGKGTGLGLSTVIGIVQQSGGHIEVESEVGGGTSFVVYLPKATDVPMLPERYLSPDQFHGNETIVLVEDSEPVRKLIVRCLGRHGYTVLEAASGIEALRYFNRHEEPIHLLLSDVILPKMDGFEIAKRAREIRPEIRVIYMSGFTDDSLTKHGVRLEDITLLEKPFTPSTLLRQIREFLDSEPEPAPGDVDSAPIDSEEGFKA